MIGEFSDDRADAVAVQELAFGFFHMQDDFGTALGFFYGFERVIALARRFPTHAVALVGTGFAGG